MKFICEKSTLLKEIAIAQEIIGSKSTINVLSNIYLEAENDTLLIKASDITVYFQTKVTVSVWEKGSTTVKGNIFLSILNTIPDGELEFEKIESKVVIRVIKSKKIKFDLKTNSTEQYPESPVLKDSSAFIMSAKDFKDMISQTIFAVSDDETRILMNGVYFEKSEDKFIMVATDGRRLAYIQKAVQGDVKDFNGIIIPEKILSVVQKRLSEEGEVSIGITDKNIFISFGTYSFSSLLIEGKFPDYQRVIPQDHDRSFKFNRLEILDAIKRISLLVEEKTKRIYLRLTKGVLSVYAQDSDKGSASEDIGSDYDGDDDQISLNYIYIDEPLRIIKEDEVSIHFKDTVKAITVKPVPESDFFHIVMPMQVD